jgi:SsrA-binding protein
MATKLVQSKREERTTDRVVTSNRRALHEYFILQSVEAGIGELWLMGAHISPYSHGSYFNHDPDRPRRLLVHKSQIRELKAQVEQKGMTIIPLRIALRKGRAKVDLGVARGKKLWDKRAASAERDANREIARAMRDSE